MKEEKKEKKERLKKERTSRGERRLKKGKIMLVGIIIIVLIIAIIVGVVLFINRKGKNTEGNLEEEISNVVELPETTYSDMKVTDINMQLLEDNNETMISMIITNTTEKTVEKEDLTAILVDANGESLAQIPTYIDYLAQGEQYSISVILKGDLTSTTQILLQKEEAQTPEQ